MGEAGVIRPGAGEVIGDSPARRVEVLADHDALHATWSRYGPRRDGADLHVHRRHTDVFYVLAGELGVRLGPAGDLIAVRAGTLVCVPPLVVHGFRNPGDAELRYLNLHAPGVGFADYLRAMRDGRTVDFDQEPPPADGGRPPAEAAIGGTAFATERDGVRVALLADVEAVAIAELSAEAGLPAAPAHVHARHGESCYVLAGEPVFTLGGREVRAEPGSWVHVPPGVPHAVASPAAARLLSVHAPACGFGAFLRALDGGDEDGAAARSGFDQAPVTPGAA